MQRTLILALSLLCLTAILINQANAVCNMCNGNNVACINTTSYNLCYNDVADKSSAFNCPPDEICVTFRGIKCLAANQAGPYVGCDPAKTCNRCIVGTTNKMFSCTSRTTFVQCEKRSVKGACPTGLFCKASGDDDICVSECRAKIGGYDCDSVEEVTLA